MDPASTEILNNSENYLLSFIYEILNTEDLENLFIETAKAAKTITNSRHGVVILPVENNERLKVVGVTGAPRKDDGIFPSNVGVIGQAYTEKCFKIVDNVNDEQWKGVFEPFDDLVKSELAVPIFDDIFKEVKAIINVEHYKEGHYEKYMKNELYELGRFMLLRLEQLQRNSRLKRDYFRITKEREQFKKLIESIPDEVLIIDKNYRPVYANKVKRKNIPSLEQFFISNSCDLDNIFKLSNSDSGVSPKSQLCHYIIEGRQQKCEKCICQNAMSSGESKTGIIYKPENIKEISYVELSAAPIYDEKENLIGCLEIGRNISKRQVVIEEFKKIFYSISENNLFRNITNLLVDSLGFEDAKVYRISADEVTEVKLVGLTHRAGINETNNDNFNVTGTISSEIVNEINVNIPTHFVVSDSLKTDNAENYCEINCSFDTINEIVKCVDINQLHNNDENREFIITKISFESQHWLVIIDSASSSSDFNSDDLQAMFIITKIALATLERMRENRTRFKLAVIGETSMGIEHIFARHSRGPEDLDKNLKFISKFLDKFSEYKSETENKLDDFLSQIFKILKNSIDSKIVIPQNGDIMSENIELKNLVDNSRFPDDIDAVSRIALIDEQLQLILKDIVKNETENNKKVYLLIESIVQLLDSMHSQNNTYEELKLYLKAFESIESETSFSSTDKDESISIANTQKYDIVKLIDYVKKLMANTKEINPQNINIEFEPGDKSFMTKINIGAVFLAFQALLKNAIDAAGKEENDTPIVTIEVDSFQKNNTEYAKVEIANNGDKIRKEDEDKILHEPVVSTKHKGSGLGLFFVGEWIRDNGGEAKHETKNNYTIFNVVFPLTLD